VPAVFRTTVVLRGADGEDVAALVERERPAEVVVRACVYFKSSTRL